MLNFAAKSVYDLHFPPLVNFFTSRGVETLTPVGYYALMGTLAITAILTLLNVLTGIGSDERQEREECFRNAFGIAMTGAASFYTLLYAELYVFRTGAWMVLLPALIIGGAYFFRRRRMTRRKQAKEELHRKKGPKQITNPTINFDDFKKKEKTARPQEIPLPEKKPQRTKQKRKEGSALEELESLIGLESVKTIVRNMAALVQINQMRKKAGLLALAMNNHMVFTGNPGTGKTTVARLIGAIFFDAGLLPHGKVTEIGARDLVGEYIGQTVPKVDGIVAKAMGGVLFIDEAYSLVQKETRNDFGQEAIARLLTHIDDYRDQFIVIMAGYTKEMDEMLTFNPGMQSRMKTRIHFPDYGADELARIFELECKNKQFFLTNDAREKVSRLCAQMHAGKKRHFGNGRAMRNAFESAVEKQAIRLVNKKPTRRDLQTFCATDIPALDELNW